MPSLNLYRNISFIFIVFAIIILVAVFSFFSTKATILITPNPQEINLSFNLEIKEDPTQIELEEKDVVVGKMEVHTRKGSGSFEVLSTKTVDSEIVGRVEIVNKNNRDQTLVKTTQLQADNGVIVRTNSAVVVPAGGSVMVDVFAKDPATFVDTDPGNLVIIKLNPSLQDKIYAISDKVLTNSPREVKVLASSDINRAKEELGEILLTELNNEKMVAEGDNFVLSIKNQKADSEIGAEVDNFTLEGDIELKVLRTNDEQLANLILRKVGNLDLSGLEIGKIDIGNIEYLIIEEDLAGSILVKVNYSLFTGINENNPLLDKSSFVGRSRDEVVGLLSGQDLINDVEVLVSPSWRTSLPKQESKIKIIIAQ
jgi:hypothetical protein